MVATSEADLGLSPDQVKPQYLDILSGEIEKNLYIIYIKTQVMKQVFPSKGCLIV
jgi:hypothetical protein